MEYIKTEVSEASTIEPQNSLPLRAVQLARAEYSAQPLSQQIERLAKIFWMKHKRQQELFELIGDNKR